MSKRLIDVLIKVTIIILFLSGLICCFEMRRILSYILPGFSPMTHRMWLVAMYICALPCFASLIPAWLIAGNIGQNRSFCNENALYIKAIGILMAIDTALVAISDAALFVIGRSFFALLISFSLIISIFLAISICAFALSSMIKNAAVLQDQSDYTI